jgi:hypothetical protein
VIMGALHAVSSDREAKPECDIEEAHRFLKHLDPNASVFTFATFTDAKDKPRPDPLARDSDGHLGRAGFVAGAPELDGCGRVRHGE